MADAIKAEGRRPVRHRRRHPRHRRRDRTRIAVARVRHVAGITVREREATVRSDQKDLSAERTVASLLTEMAAAAWLDG
jgi:hypothetical protein